MDKINHVNISFDDGVADYVIELNNLPFGDETFELIRSLVRFVSRTHRQVGIYSDLMWDECAGVRYLSVTLYPAPVVGRTPGYQSVRWAYGMCELDYHNDHAFSYVDPSGNRPYMMLRDPNSPRVPIVIYKCFKDSEKLDHACIEARGRGYRYYLSREDCDGYPFFDLISESDWNNIPKFIRDDIQVL